jgi:hypothetical protein
LVKTTLELPGDLLRRTKAEAASAGQSMKDLVTEALEERLKSRKRLTGGGWRSVFGRASRAAVQEVDKRLRDLERVHPEEWA